MLRLADALNQVLEARKLSQADAAEVLGVTLFKGLPQANQNANMAIVSKPGLACRSRDDSHSHSIWVAPEFIERISRD